MRRRAGFLGFGIEQDPTAGDPRPAVPMLVTGVVSDTALQQAAAEKARREAAVRAAMKYGRMFPAPEAAPSTPAGVGKALPIALGALAALMLLR
jgi:hypothetical protein